MTSTAHAQRKKPTKDADAPPAVEMLEYTNPRVIEMQIGLRHHGWRWRAQLYDGHHGLSNGMARAESRNTGNEFSFDSKAQLSRFAR